MSLYRALGAVCVNNQCSWLQRPQSREQCVSATSNPPWKPKIGVLKNRILHEPSRVASLDVFQWIKKTHNINHLVNLMCSHSGTFYQHIWLLDDFPGIFSCLFLLVSLFCFLRGSKCYADSYLSSRAVTAAWQDCEDDLIPQSLVYWQPFSQACLHTLNRII